MYTLFVILIVIAAILMIGIVLIQESKGGGLSSSFAGYNQVAGVRKTTDFIEKQHHLRMGSTHRQHRFFCDGGYREPCNQS